MNHIVIRLCLSLMACSILCQAEEPRHDAIAIEKLVADSLDAARRGDWKGYAELVHPESLHDFKNMWLPALQLAVAKGPGEQADVLALFEKGSDANSLVTMKPKELFVSSMKGLAIQFPQAKPMDSKIIGTVREGDALAYVIVRSRIKDSKVTKIEVVTLRRCDTEWKMTLPEVVQVMAESFTRTLNSGPAQTIPITDRPESSP
jgi:hypothetical protein